MISPKANTIGLDIILFIYSSLFVLGPDKPMTTLAPFKISINLYFSQFLIVISANFYLNGFIPSLPPLYILYFETIKTFNIF